MMRIALSILFVFACVAAGCSKKSGDASKTKTEPAAKTASSGNYLTVGAYCDAFCSKLCGTCGNADCPPACKTRCLFNRPADMLLDGKDPKTALALTQKELDACTATITADSCPKIMAGEVPDQCHTIQH